MNKTTRTVLEMQNDHSGYYYCTVYVVLKISHHRMMIAIDFTAEIADSDPSTRYPLQNRLFQNMKSFKAVL